MPSTSQQAFWGFDALAHVLHRCSPASTLPYINPLVHTHNLTNSNFFLMPTRMVTPTSKSAALHTQVQEDLPNPQHHLLLLLGLAAKLRRPLLCVGPQGSHVGGRLSLLLATKLRRPLRGCSWALHHLHKQAGNRRDVRRRWRDTRLLPAHHRQGIGEAKGTREAMGSTRAAYIHNQGHPPCSPQT